MKQFKLIITAATILLSLASCEKEKPEDPSNPSEGGNQPVVAKTVLSVSAANVTKGETTAYTAVFSESDDIVVNAQKSSSVTLKETGAEFAIGKKLDPPYLAVAPSSAVDASSFNLSEKSARLKLSGARKPLAASTFSLADVPMAAYSAESADFTLKHLMTFFSVTFTGGQNPIKTITLKKNGLKNGLSGTWIVNAKNDGSFELNTEAVLDPFVYDCHDSGIQAGTPVVIAVPAYNFDEGLKLTVVDTDERTQTYDIAADKTDFSAKAGQIVEFSFDFTPVAETEMEIGSAEEFLAFITKVNGGEIADNVTIKLTADIELTTPAAITGKNGKFTNKFNGGNHTITVNNGNHALFRNAHGLIQNLTIDGNFGPDENGWIGVLVDSLYTGGLIKNCTNKASVSGTSGDEHVLVGGTIARLIYGGGTIEDCTNKGAITLNPIMTSKFTTCYFGGIVGVINHTRDVVLRDCKNEGTITVNPENTKTDYNIDFPGFGGIVGWIRSAAANVLLENCDNSADITINKDKRITDGVGSVVSVGGIVGLGSPYGTSYHALSTPSETNGLDVKMKDCDNTGDICNMALSRIASDKIRLKSFTGGLAGSLYGKASKRISIENCTVKDCSLIPYDATGEGASQRPGYCTCVGGAIGYGGYLDITGCTFSPVIGNGKRQSATWAGVIGFAITPFSLTGSKVYAQGYFNRVPGFEGNRASIAVVPTQYTGTSSNTVTNPVGNVSGSVISGCQLGGSLYISDSTYEDTDTSDLSGYCTHELFTTLDETVANAVCGEGFTANTGVTIENNTSWDGK